MHSPALLWHTVIFINSVIYACLTSPRLPFSFLLQVIQHHNSLAFALRRFDTARTTLKIVTMAMEIWLSMPEHPAITRPREVSLNSAGPAGGLGGGGHFFSRRIMLCFFGVGFHKYDKLKTMLPCSNCIPVVVKLGLREKKL